MWKHIFLLFWSYFPRRNTTTHCNVVLLDVNLKYDVAIIRYHATPSYSSDMQPLAIGYQINKIKNSYFDINLYVVNTGTHDKLIVSRQYYMTTG